MIPVVAKPQVEPIQWLGLHRQYLNDGEMEIICALVRSTPARSMLEIGCRDGRTARVILNNVLSLEKYVGVDVTPDYVPTLFHQRAEMVEFPGRLAVTDPRFELIVREKGSLDLSPQHFMAFDHGPFDAVFIDGDHSEPCVIHDSYLAREIVGSGGVIIYHDYTNKAVEVQRALDRLLSEGWPLQHIEGTWLAYLRT